MIDKVFPWQCGLMRSVSEDHVTTSQLIETIDALIYDDVTDGGDKQMQVRSFFTAAVLHLIAFCYILITAIAVFIMGFTSIFCDVFYTSSVCF